MQQNKVKGKEGREREREEERGRETKVKGRMKGSNVG